MSHDLELLPEQSEPPFEGGGFVHVRVCTPVPQPELEVHVPYADQPPSTGVGVVPVPPNDVQVTESNLVLSAKLSLWFERV